MPVGSNSDSVCRVITRGALQPLIAALHVADNEIIGPQLEEAQFDYVVGPAWLEKLSFAIPPDILAAAPARRQLLCPTGPQAASVADAGPHANCERQSRRCWYEKRGVRGPAL